MPQLETQNAFRRIQGLAFCYVCGMAFAKGEKRTRDHVPARACFAPVDRHDPLLLPTHADCNSDNTLIDEKIGQLIGLRRGAVPAPSNRRLSILTADSADGGLMGGVSNLDIPHAVKRWICAFHAALYHEWLPPQTGFVLETPFPAGKLEGGTVAYRPIREQHQVMVAVIKQQRSAGNLDRIQSNNGQLRYECVWERSDDGGWFCIFALDLYGWADLGDTKRFPRRGCAGFYVLPQRRVPKGATRVIEASEGVANADPNDPFGE